MKEEKMSIIGSDWEDKDDFEEFLESEIRAADYGNWRAIPTLKHIRDEYRKHKDGDGKVIEHFKDE
jgi:hypothetical protein